MSKFQLTMSPEYVRDWTHVEAIREIFQNALDNQTVNPENEMFHSYDPQEELLLIGNKTSVLELDSLLLGSSTKRDDERTIGSHGEGYKVALMVLLREGKNLTFYNYGKSEVWRTRLVKSRRFNGATIPEITVDRKFRWYKRPSHDLIIEVEGITPKEYEDIIESNLHLQDEVESLNFNDSVDQILLNEKFRGKMYVNGLYICTNDNFRYGYSFDPKRVRLDRDRRILDSYDISLITSKLWRYSDKPETVAKLVLEDVWDVRFLKSTRDYLNDKSSMEEDRIEKDIRESLREVYKEQHGDNTVPVHSNAELELASRSSTGYKPVIVSRQVVEFFEKDEIVPKIEVKSTKERLSEWLEGVESKLSEEEITDFQMILDDMN